MNQKEASVLISIALATMPNLRDKDLAPTVKAWSLIMADVPFDEAKAGLIKVLREKKIPTLPMPADILSAIDDIKAAQHKTEYPPDYLAWREAKRCIFEYREPKFEHEVVREAVRVIGWGNIYYSNHDMSDYFMKVYNKIVERKKKNKTIDNTLKICYANGLKVKGVIDHEN